MAVSFVDFTNMFAENVGLDFPWYDATGNIETRGSLSRVLSHPLNTNAHFLSFFSLNFKYYNFLDGLVLGFFLQLCRPEQ